LIMFIGGIWFAISLSMITSIVSAYRTPNVEAKEKL